MVGKHYLAFARRKMKDFNFEHALTLAFAVYSQKHPLSITFVMLIFMCTYQMLFV